MERRQEEKGHNKSGLERGENLLGSQAVPATLEGWLEPRAGLRCAVLIGGPH